MDVINAGLIKPPPQSFGSILLNPDFPVALAARHRRDFGIPTRVVECASEPRATTAAFRNDNGGDGVVREPHHVVVAEKATDASHIKLLPRPGDAIHQVVCGLQLGLLSEFDGYRPAFCWHGVVMQKSRITPAARSNIQAGQRIVSYRPLVVETDDAPEALHARSLTGRIVHAVQQPHRGHGFAHALALPNWQSTPLAPPAAADETGATAVALCNVNGGGHVVINGVFQVQTDEATQVVHAPNPKLGAGRPPMRVRDWGAPTWTDRRRPARLGEGGAALRDSHKRVSMFVPQRKSTRGRSPGEFLPTGGYSGADPSARRSRRQLRGAGVLSKLRTDRHKLGMGAQDPIAACGVGEVLCGLDARVIDTGQWAVCALGLVGASGIGSDDRELGIAPWAGLVGAMRHRSRTHAATSSVWIGASMFRISAALRLPS